MARAAARPVARPLRELSADASGYDPQETVTPVG